MCRLLSTRSAVAGSSSSACTWSLWLRQAPTGSSATDGPGREGDPRRRRPGTPGTTRPGDRRHREPASPPRGPARPSRWCPATRAVKPPATRRWNSAGSDWRTDIGGHGDSLLRGRRCRVMITAEPGSVGLEDGRGRGRAGRRWRPGRGGGRRRRRPGARRSRSRAARARRSRAPTHTAAARQAAIRCTCRETESGSGPGAEVEPIREPARRRGRRSWQDRRQAEGVEVLDAERGDGPDGAVAGQVQDVDLVRPEPVVAGGAQVAGRGGLGVRPGGQQPPLTRVSRARRASRGRPRGPRTGTEPAAW